MFPFPIAKPQGCDIQTFYGVAEPTTGKDQKSWNKPVGVSHVYMMLIGSGANGDGSSGGGSGAVTVWYGAAQHVPDALIVSIGFHSLGTHTEVQARFKTATLAGTVLLQAQSAVSSAGAGSTAANQFGNSGFYYSVNGQAGHTGSSSSTPSVSTFLSGGNDGTNIVVSNYGYTNGVPGAGTAGNGYFQMQPIIVGVAASSDKRAGIGCGGGIVSGAGGAGNGMVLIASW